MVVRGCAMRDRETGVRRPRREEGLGLGGTTQSNEDDVEVSGGVIS